MTTVAVVGLGYVGLPLAVEFGKKHPTIGFDLSAQKVAAYRKHVDPTGEVSSDELRAASQLRVTTDPQVLGAKPTSSSSPSRRRSTMLISPTSARCSARPKRSAGTSSAARSSFTNPPFIPARPRKICVPVLEQLSGLGLEADFKVGYSSGADQSGR